MNERQLRILMHPAVLALLLDGKPVPANVLRRIKAMGRRGLIVNQGDGRERTSE